MKTVTQSPVPIIRAKPEGGLFKLKIHELAPEDFVPNGDRYVVEAIEIEEDVEFGQLLVRNYAAPGPKGRPWEMSDVEARGCFAAVVLSAGNGHLLGLPDWADRPSSASVPMFYGVGDVVLVDFNGKGRNLKIMGRQVRVVNQIDVLCGIPRAKLMLVDGKWQEPVEA